MFDSFITLLKLSRKNRFCHAGNRLFCKLLYVHTEYHITNRMETVVQNNLTISIIFLHIYLFLQANYVTRSPSPGNPET